jgi:GNAT superfamily N-acetyltransferase
LAEPAWRSLQPTELPEVLALADAVHGAAFHEPLAVFAERQKLFPEGCLAGGVPLLAYAIAHPWRGKAPALASLLGSLPEAPDCLYLHDAVVAPKARGTGLGNALVTRLVALARAKNLPALALTAVHGSAAYWGRHGFAPCAGAGLESYGDGAVAMRRAL